MKARHRIDPDPRFAARENAPPSQVHIRQAPGSSETVPMLFAPSTGISRGRLGCAPPCAAQRARSIDHPPLGPASPMYPPMYPVVAPTDPPTTTPARTLPASTAVREPGCALSFKGSLQPPHLAEADPQGLGRLPSGNPPGTCCVHQPGRCSSFRLNSP